GGVEYAPLDEDVPRFGDLRRGWQHLGQREVEIRVRIVEFRRYGVRAEPRRDPPRGFDCTQRRELRLTVEAVARFRLEGRRARAQHPAAVLADRGRKRLLSRRTRRMNGRHDPSPRGVELLVRRPRRAQRELLHAVTGEARMRVTVDEPRDRTATAAVDLLDLSVEPWQITHTADGLDRRAHAEDVRVLDHVHLAERAAA